MKRVVVIFLLAVGLFSFRLTQVPRGLTVDEIAFSKNAQLIAQTGRDENGRFLPVFVLSHAGQDGDDWRQPYTQYLTVVMYWLFGPSIHNLKFGSVLLAGSAVALIYWLGEHIWPWEKRWALVAAALLASTPLVMIHSHLGLDPIMVLPFVLLWLIAVWQKKWTWAALALGLNYYAYRGMRAVVPVWTGLTAALIGTNKKLIIFGLWLIPFIVMVPLLEWKYAGAVIDRQSGIEDSVYDFAYYYLGSFDLSTLFVKGDEQLFHTTGRHGMFLLATLPWFTVGMYTAIKKKEPFWLVVAAAWWLGPLLYGFIGSTHRGHRLMFLVPLYVLLTTLGCRQLATSKQALVRRINIGLIILVVINWWDFISYYWFRYASDTAHLFYPPDGL
ncbi:MAG: hypothetical protein Q7S31_02735 [bacterium]|nr:hypothetical protein [bacterium]